MLNTKRAAAALLVAGAALAADTKRTEQLLAQARLEALPSRTIPPVLGPTQWVNLMVLSPDGRFAAGQVVNPNQNLRLWSVAGKELQQFDIHTNNDSINEVAFSRDGRLLAVISSPELQKHQATQTQIYRVFPKTFGQPPPAPTVDPAAPRNEPPPVTTVLAIWETETGKQVLRIPHGVYPTTVKLAFAPDSKELASDIGSRILLLDVASGRETQSFSLLSSEDSRFAPAGGTPLSPMIDGGTLALSPDGKLVAATLSCSIGVPVNDRAYRQGYDQREGLTVIVVWERRTGKEILRRRNPGFRPDSLLFSPDGKTLVLQQLGALRLHFWDVASGKEISTIENFACHGLVFSPDGKTLLCSNEAAVQVWEVGSGKRRNQFQAEAHIDMSNRGLAATRSEIKSIAFLAGGPTFLTAGANATISRWRLDDLPENVPDHKVRHIGAEVNPPTEVHP